MVYLVAAENRGNLIEQRSFNSDINERESNRLVKYQEPRIS